MELFSAIIFPSIFTFRKSDNKNSPFQIWRGFEVYMIREPQVSFFPIRSKDAFVRRDKAIADPLLKPIVRVSKPEIKHEIAEKKQNSLGILHPCIFKGMSTVVRLENAMLKKIIEESLRIVGSIILPETSPIVDIIVSDKPITIVTLPLNQRSRGNRMATAIRHTATPVSQPQVILLQQIPWAFQRHKKPEQTTPQKADQQSFKGVVVADEAHVKRPLYRPMEKMPVIYDCEVPKGYTFTPFAQPPQDPTILLQKYQNYHKNKEKKQAALLGPADDGFCEICGCSFKNAEQHHNSPEHQAKANDNDLWADFDAFTNML